MNLLAGRNPRLVGRATLLALAFTAIAGFVILLVGFSPAWDLPWIVKGSGNSKTVDLFPRPAPPTPKIPLCNVDTHRAGVAEFLEAAEAKYAKLRDDKFTIAIQTYRRPVELNTTLTTILSSPDVPSLHEVVVVWNNLEETPPANFTSDRGVPVRYRRSPRNSLNEKLKPDPDFQTQAILLSDDDVFFYPSDLEFVFQSWRKFGRDRLVGGLPRCAWVDDRGDWRYDMCDKKKDEYAMIITNLAFAHVKFLDYYTLAEDEATKAIRAHVDDHLNCEDIGMNYVASMLTRTGPLLVRGHREYHNFAPRMSISGKPGHLVARSKCLNIFAELFGCMPLINETARVERGVVPRRV
ncbi:multiple-like 3 [Sodiomyces alkalinus F11]|uniref:Multiple-like 3 n=1 Tax=Sodiomyces alkalinus (strain CBS 110278 / VKM F-3762 / F11) TaxID=1314773 RepID=A0A3N2PS22_SODAK|nr:multiple-like 3 [Sodiomyces alkalinus F11]ROT37136.1 multiple-like 3 [Sodiomyces alkalinus F11]